MSWAIAGDIGGTNARLVLVDVEHSELLHEHIYPSKDFKTFDQVLARFLADTREVVGAKTTFPSASFGIAGPVVGGRVKTTNLPWLVDAHALARKFHIPRVSLLNDLVAVGFGAMAAPTSKVKKIHGPGRPRKDGGTLAILSAGTGLGEAAFVWDGEGHVPMATEGSHVEFAPRSALEMRLLAKLAKKHGHVSYERVASGSTFSMLYRFFVEDERVRESAKNRDRIARAKDPNVEVVTLAVEGGSEAAMRAVDLWCSVYGAEAGNLALKTFATAGVYICGGVASSMVKVLAHGLPARNAKTSPFVEAFLDKGRMRALVEKIPVAVVLEPKTGLLGAAAHAAHAASTARS